MFVPVNEPVISKEAKDNVSTALSTGWLSSAGPFVREFEKSFSDYLGMKYASAVSSGTAALHVALMSLGIGRGDEVIVPAFTMAATWLAVMHVGAKPVFVDCELETYNIDADRIEEKITSKTKAIIPVHIYGHSADMDKIMDIAKKHSLYVIEDAAEAHGAIYKGKKCGSMGDINCFSFYANKIITTGEGGMILTNDEKLAKEVNKFKDLYHSDSKRFIHEKIGYNYRMTNLQASVGCGELKNIDTYLDKKRKMAAMYDEGLRDVLGIKTPVTRPSVENVYWMYAILVDKDKFGLDRDELRVQLKSSGVDTRDFFYAPEDQPVLNEVVNGFSFPNTKYISECGLYLPSGLAITDEQINYVIESIKKLAS